jgi:hypothetical protein
MSNTSSDLSDFSDDDFDDVSNVTTQFTDRVKFYQVHHVSEDSYKFSCVGFFKKEEKISIELTKFDHEDFYCVISNNIVKFEEQSSIMLQKNNLYLFDMITMDVLKKDGKNFKIVLAVELKDPNFDGENKGNLMIWVHYKDKQIPIKTGLTHPGKERLPYYIIGELKNEKINELLNEEKIE